MKLILTRDDLLEPLGLVAPVVDSRHPTAILTNVLLQVSGQQLWLTATDNELQLQGVSNLPTPFEQVMLTVPARKLMDICKSLPENAEIELEFAEKNLLLRSGKSRFRLATLPAEQFPVMEAQPSSVEFAVRQCELLHLLQQTHFAIAQQDVRYYLNGLLLTFGDNMMRAVATDGHRLALSELPAEASTENIPSDCQVLIPRKAVHELVRLLEPFEQTVQVAIHEQQLRVVGVDFNFMTKLISGRYPDYNRVIPANPSMELIIEKDLIKQAVSRAAILSNENARGVRLQLYPNLLCIRANNPDHETAEEELDVEYHGEEFEVALNVSYLLDIFNAISSDNVRFEFSDAMTGVRVTGVGEDANLYIIMPMRL